VPLATFDSRVMVTNKLAWELTMATIVTMFDPLLPADVRQVGSSSRHNLLAPIPGIYLTEVVLDVLTILIVGKIGIRIDDSYLSPERLSDTPHIWAFAFLLVAISLLFLNKTGVYSTSGGLLRIRETASVIQAVALIFATLCCFAVLGDRHLLPVLCIATPLFLLALIVQKQVLHACFDTLWHSARGTGRVVIYGSAASANLLWSAMIRSPKLGLSPVAMILEAEGDAAKAAPLPDASLLRSYGTDILLFASRPESREAEKALLVESQIAGARVVYAAETSNLTPAEIDYVEFDGQIVFGAHESRSRIAMDFAMQCMDTIGSLFLVCLFGLPMLIIALIIRSESAGPALFRQQRVGLNGKLFTILKFRTMHLNACGDQVSPLTSYDPRLTKVGRVLRKLSLDELPQLLNVLAGDMALVGPRPEMPFIVKQYTATHRRRLAVKPGVTGIWQLSADRCRPIHENIHYDLYYLKHRSVSMYVAVLLHTLLFAMRGT
jgi:lipopolysaccharide/colanic/teichoic acid biosynthesis glycosyltransferase